MATMWYANLIGFTSHNRRLDKVGNGQEKEDLKQLKSQVSINMHTTGYKSMMASHNFQRRYQPVSLLCLRWGIIYNNRNTILGVYEDITHNNKDDRVLLSTYFCYCLTMFTLKHILVDPFYSLVFVLQTCLDVPYYHDINSQTAQPW